ncbi:MAG TPA: sugar transferase [Vicinamibacterales bacterium]|nr:sugar transferase [Vicinamibacterales bacterium]
MSATYRTSGKRAFDLALVLLTTPCWLPVVAVVALIVRTQIGSPVLFRQARPGRGGRVFMLVKFRTMADARDERGELLPDALRLTTWGRLLRASSLDELPELWNVIRGDMSLVGPRPLLVSYLDRYTAEQSRRHEVRPGITGLAQVNGRNALCWEDRFALDVRYVDTCSFGLDTRILFRTIGNVVARRGISEPGQATAQEFMGSAR